MQSNEPEEMILAILGNFQNQNLEIVVKEIVNRIEKISSRGLEKQKVFNQLLSLGRLRKLELKIQEIMDSISKYINIEEDGLYLQGIEKGIQKGIEKGIEKGIHQFVVNLILGTDFSDEKIANLASISVEFVKQIRIELISLP